MSKSNRISCSVEKKNSQMVDKIISGSTEFIFGRVEANLGSYFRLVVQGTGSGAGAGAGAGAATTILASPRGLFKQRKAQMRFSKGDIVIVSASASAGSSISEIIGRLPPAAVQELRKAGRIHSSIVAESVTDDIFDYMSDADIDAI